MECKVRSLFSMYSTAGRYSRSIVECKLKVLERSKEVEKVEKEDHITNLLFITGSFRLQKSEGSRRRKRTGESEKPGRKAKTGRRNKGTERDSFR